MEWIRQNLGRRDPEPVLGGDRVPPGQYVSPKLPVMSYAGTPRIGLGDWRLKLSGFVEEPVELDWEGFTAMPQTVVRADFHCVTQWSRLGNTWEGVLANAIIERCRPSPEAAYVMVHCFDGYTTNLPLGALTSPDVLFAHRHDGEPLAPAHGGPMRLVVPALYGWKSAKWVSGLEFRAEDSPGFWEMRGYHMRGDPWREERFG